MLDCKRWEEVRFVATSLCSSVKDGKKYDLLPPVCAQRWEELRFVATSLRCSIVKDVKKYGLLPPVCARLSKMGRSTICCHQFVLDCQRWEEGRFVATSLCSIVKDGKKYNLLPRVCARLSKMGKSTIYSQQFAVLDGQRWEKVRFVATSLRCSVVKDGKKYDLLPPVRARVSMMASTICCHQFVLKDGKKYGLLPPVCARLSKMGRSTVCCHLSKMGGSTICCHQFVLDCKRWEEVRFVATSLRSSIVKDRKKYDLLPPVCAQRWEEVRLVATGLRCSIVKDGKKYDLLPLVKNGRKYDLLPPVCARLSKMGRSTICCHQFAVLDCQR